MEASLGDDPLLGRKGSLPLFHSFPLSQAVPKNTRKLVGQVIADMDYDNNFIICITLFLICIIIVIIMV